MAPKSNKKNILQILVIAILVTALFISSINVVAENDLNNQPGSKTAESEHDTADEVSFVKITDTEMTDRLESQLYLDELGSYDDQILSSAPPLSGKTIPKTTGTGGSPRGEPDDNPNEANELKHGDKNIEGDVTSQVPPSGQLNIIDADWYMILMHEFGPVKTEYVKISINNSNAPIGTDQRFVVDVYETMFTFVWFNDNLQHSSRLDREIFAAYEEKTVEFSSPINAMVFMVIFSIDGAKIDYNITDVNVTMTQPSLDMNNYPGNATKPSGTSINGKVIQNKDHWDWYDISQYFILEENYTNNVTFSVDITNENRDANAGWFSWTEIWLFYDNKAGTQYNIYGGWGGSQGVIYSGGIHSEPINGWRNVDGSEMYIGIKTEGGFISQGQVYAMDTHNGWAEYTLSFAVDHVDLNSKPALTNGIVDPKVGTTSEYFTFQITYTDENSDPPAYVNVSIDGTDYPMAPTSGGTYATGMVYEKTIKGSSLTDYPYPHSYYFEAADYRATDRWPEINFGDKQDLKVINNEPPYVLETAPETLIMDEDNEISDIALNQIFADPDGSTELEYEVWVGPNEDDYTINYDSDLLKVSFSSSLVKFKPKENQHGEEDIRLRVTDPFTYTDFINSITDTYNFRAYHNITVTVNPVNDNPSLAYISDQTLTQDSTYYLTVYATDNDIEVDADELTFTTNVTDGQGTDDIPEFSIQPNATNPGTSADITFMPTNDNVGTTWVRITVKDKAQTSDWVNVKFVVTNLNDEPEFITIGSKEYDADEDVVNFIGSAGATEDEWFNITVVADDIDIKAGAGDKLTFETNITDGQGNDDEDSFYINPDPSNPKQALISFYPTNEDVGYLKFNLTVYDGKGGKSKTRVLIEVENVNDPPGEPEITNPKSGNLSFSIVEQINFTGACDDPDLHIPESTEKLTYTWTSNVTEVDLGTGKTIFVDKLERLFDVGYVRITLTVNDKAGIELSTSLTIKITDDYDDDGIWDDWEEEFGLNYRDKMDAYGDYDLDGFSNYEEFLGHNGLPDYLDSTNPYDSNDHPKKAGEDDDMSWLWMMVGLIIIIIVALVIFGMYRKKKKAEEEEDEFFESMPASSGSPPEGPMGMGMGGLPPPGGLGGGLPPPLAPPPSLGTGAPPFMPPLPPAGTGTSSESDQSRFGGIRSSGLETTSTDDDLTSGYDEPDVVAEDLSVSDTGGEDVKVWSPGASKDSGKKPQEPKCSSCGAEVQAGWFICPTCKSPLRSK
jgi:hypothetical protein